MATPNGKRGAWTSGFLDVDRGVLSRFTSDAGLRSIQLGRLTANAWCSALSAGEQVSTSPVHACRAGCWLARPTCSPARHSINTHGAVQASRNHSIPAKLAVALSIVLCLCVPFAILSFQLATGLEPSPGFPLVELPDIPKPLDLGNLA